MSVLFFHLGCVKFKDLLSFLIKTVGKLQEDLSFLFNSVCSIIMLYIMFVLQDDFRHDYLCLSV